MPSKGPTPYIVTDPFQARKVINDGKLGIEVSRLFHCGLQNGVPQCTRDSIDRDLAEAYNMGIRDLELVNKFDTGLRGVAGDAGPSAWRSTPRTSRRPARSGGCRPATRPTRTSTTATRRPRCPAASRTGSSAPGSPAAAHGARRPSTEASRVRDGRRLPGGIVVKSAGKGRLYAFVVRRGRVAAMAVMGDQASRTTGRLREHLRLAKAIDAR